MAETAYVTFWFGAALQNKKRKKKRRDRVRLLHCVKDSFSPVS